MKRLLLVLACSITHSLYAPAQSVSAAIDQLAALQTLGQTIEQGYQTITTGLNTIYSIRTAEFGLHNTYISDLDTIQPTVAADEKLQAIRTQLTQLITRIRSTLDELQADAIPSN